MKKLLSILLCLALLGSFATLCAYAEEENPQEAAIVAEDPPAEETAAEPAVQTQGLEETTPVAAAPQSVNTDAIALQSQEKYAAALQAALDSLLFVTDGAKAYNSGYTKETFLNEIKAKLEGLPEAAAFRALVGDTAAMEALYNNSAASLEAKLNELVNAFSAAAKAKAFGFAVTAANTQCSARYNRLVIKYAKYYEERKAKVTAAIVEDPTWQYGPSYRQGGADQLFKTTDAFIADEKVQGYLAKGWFYTARTAYVNAILAVNTSLYDVGVDKRPIWERRDGWYFLFRYLFFGFIWMKF